MATKKCPQCAEKIQADARVCRFCSYQFSDSQLWALQAEKKFRRFGCVALVALPILGIWLLGSGEQDGPREDQPADIKYSAERHLRKALKDGDSAKLGPNFVSAIGDKMGFCGEVNSKNSFGAYTGFKRFIATANEDGFVMIDDGSTGTVFGAAWVRFCSSPIKRWDD